MPAVFTGSSLATAERSHYAARSRSCRRPRMCGDRKSNCPRSAPSFPAYFRIPKPCAQVRILPGDAGKSPGQDPIDQCGPSRASRLLRRGNHPRCLGACAGVIGRGGCQRARDSARTRSSDRLKATWNPRMKFKPRSRICDLRRQGSALPKHRSLRIGQHGAWLIGSSSGISMALSSHADRPGVWLLRWAPGEQPVSPRCHRWS